MKRILIISTIIISTLSLKGQQNPLYTQYMFNPVMINPAITGTHSYYQIWLNSRLQWIGMTDAPVTNTLSIYGPFEEKDMGWGAYVYNDITGPTSRLGATGSYAYNFAINDEYRLSFGLNVGFLQYKIDKTQLTWETPIASDQSSYQRFLPDASAGAYFYSTNLHIGLSSTQLFNNKIDVVPEQSMDSLEIDEAFGRLKSHFYLTAGYKYYFGRELAIEPTMIVRAVSPATPQIDFNTRVIYTMQDNTVWGGISFRSQDALAFAMGYSYLNKLFLGISYDIGITPSRISHIGSFEAVVGYIFDDLKF